MKRYYPIWAGIIFLLVAQVAWSQRGVPPVQEKVKAAKARGEQFARVPLFARVGDPDAGMRRALSRGAILKLDKNAVRELKRRAPQSATLDIPWANGRSLTLELVKHEVVTPDFRVSTSAPHNEGAYRPGVYYQGVSHDGRRSLAAISIVGEEVMGVVDIEGEGNFILGALENDPQERYAFFKAEDLQADLKSGCDVDDSMVPQMAETLQRIETANADPGKCVRIYFECEYDMFLSRSSSVQSTVDYMTGIYNVVKTLYDNEQVNTAISEIFVWTTPDSYPTGSTSEALNAFRIARGTSFNGNLAHLVSRGAPTGGGVAYLNVTCNKSYAFAYSYIHGSYSQFPTYSWTVMVIAHEMGHNLGSPHTHNCGWDVNGDGIANEMIDGCGPSRGYSEGSCPVAPLPTNGGTVMSYCHLVSGVGINLNNGFGPLPGARIRDRVYNGTCLTACSTCPTTVSISQNNVTCPGGNDGSITATGGGSTGPYTYLWNTGATTATISNLTAGTYTVTVRGQNGAGCPTTVQVSLTQPPAFSLSTVVVPESVPGASNGSIDLTVAGGTPPYTYTWSNGATTQDLFNIPGGTYTVTVRDSRQCTTTRVVEVGSNGCGGQVNSFPAGEGFESATLTLLRQSTNDNYDWIRQSGSTPNNRTGPAGAFEGNWYMYAQGKGNTGDAILESQCLNLTDRNNARVEFAYSMNGSQIGTLTVEVSTNNGQSWTSLWSRSGNQGANWQTASLSLGAHRTAFTRVRFRATAGGNFGDIAIDAVRFLADPVACNAPVLQFSHTDATCAGGSNGTASVQVTGGQSPYTITWSNGANGPQIGGLTAGTYTATVTDNTGCQATGSVTVGAPTVLQLTLTASAVSAPGASDGAVNLSVSGGTPGYGFAWSNGATTQNISGLPSGNYSVVVTDANGCTASGSATVSEPASCEPVATLPYTEGFESSLGWWRQVSYDNFDWRRNSGGTGTSNTGPSAAAEGIFYLYASGKDGGNGSRGIVESPCVNLTGVSGGSVSFQYHMFGNQMGSMSLEVSTNDGQSWTTLWSRSGNQGNSWLSHSQSLDAYAGQVIRLRFVATLSNGVRGDMAIDAVSIVAAAGKPLMTRAKRDLDLQWLELYPNPSRGEVMLRVYSPKATSARLSLSDALGRQSDLGPWPLQAGENLLRVPLRAQANGLYLLRLTEGGQQHTRSVILMK